MTDRDPMHLDYSTFPPRMLMSVAAVYVQLHDALDASAVAAWRKTLEVFASGLRLQVDLLPMQGQAVCLHISGPGGVDLRRKGILLNWLALSQEVHSLRVLDPKQRSAPGLAIFVGRKSTLLLARQV
jgi:hypothetical protein